MQEEERSQRLRGAWVAAATAALAHSRLAQCVTHHRGESFTLRGRACRGVHSRTVKNLHAHVRAASTATPQRHRMEATLHQKKGTALAPLIISRTTSTDANALAPNTHSADSSAMASPKLGTMSRQLNQAFSDIVTLTQANRLLFQRNEELEQVRRRQVTKRRWRG